MAPNFNSLLKENMAKWKFGHFLRMEPWVMSLSHHIKKFLKKMPPHNLYPKCLANSLHQDSKIFKHLNLYLINIYGFCLFLQDSLILWSVFHLIFLWIQILLQQKFKLRMNSVFTRLCCLLRLPACPSKLGPQKYEVTFCGLGHKSHKGLVQKHLHVMGLWYKARGIFCGVSSAHKWLDGWELSNSYVQ